MTNTIKINFKEYLTEIYENPSKIHKAYSLFHKYSLSNSMLAEKQLVTLEPINTYKGWKKLGRQVIKGSKAITLLMPVFYKDENDEEKTISTFMARPYWFSLSQTEGEEFKSPTLPDFDLEKALKILNIQQETFQIMNGNIQGYARPQSNIIAINPIAFAPYKTAIHEMTHCLLHKDFDKIIDDSRLSASIMEFEAETAAYLVCCSLGKFDHLEYSRGYILNWIKKDEISEDSFKRAFDAANKILKAGAVLEENDD